MSQERPAAANAPVGARQAVSDVVIQIVGRVLNLALGVAVTIVFVRSLGDRAFGEWSTLVAVTQVFGYLAAQGFEPSAVRFAAVDPEHEPQWLAAAFSLRMVLGFPAAALSIIATLLLAHGHGGKVAALLLSSMIVLNGPTILRIVFQTRVRNWVNIVILSGNSVVWGAAVIAIASTGRASVASYAIALVAVSLATTVAQALWALKETSLRRPSAEQLRRVAGIGFALGFGALLTLIYGRIDQVMVYRISGSAQAGLYAAAYRLLDQAQIIPIAISTTLLPIIATAHHADPARLRRIVQAAFDNVAVASLPALALGIAAGTPIMTLLFGQSFAPAGAALPALMGAFVAISFGYLVAGLVVVLELQRRQIVIAVSALILNVGLNFAFVPTYGFRAAAWVTLATELLVLGLTAHAVLPRLQLRLNLNRFARTTFAATIMGLAAFATRTVDSDAIVILLVSVPPYVVLCFVLRILTVGEIRSMLQRRLP